MNRFAISILFVLIIFSSFAQSKKGKNDNGWNYEAEYQIHSDYKRLSKSAKNYLKGMVLIPGGSFISGNNLPIFATENDSNLLISNRKSQVTLGSFFLMNHETTNAEYRRFVDWVKQKNALELLHQFLPSKYPKVEGEIPVDMEIDFQGEEEGIILEKEGYYLPKEERFYNRFQVDTRNLFYELNYQGKSMKINVYPDTLCWVDENPWIFSESLFQNYFWHSAYDEYPVVGVSYFQALAYCQWLTDRLNEQILIDEKVLKQKSWSFSTDEFIKDSANTEYFFFLSHSLRLPNELEWEYAALYETETQKKDKRLNTHVFPWFGDKLTDEKGFYLANFGSIYDQNGFMVKSYFEVVNHRKGKIKKYIEQPYYQFTSPVNSFPPNSIGLYDMAGNVAEWTNSRPFGQLSYLEAFPPDGDYGLFDYRFMPSSSHPDSIEMYDLINGGHIVVKKESSQYYKIIREGDSLLQLLRVQHTDSYAEAFQKILLKQSENVKENYNVNEEMSARLNQLTLDAMHNAQVLHQTKPGRIVKGGSWNRGSAFLQSAVQQVYKEVKGYSTVGFRVLMPVVY